MTDRILDQRQDIVIRAGFGIEDFARGQARLFEPRRIEVEAG